ncbi:bifunctional diaminohydroxyphosphoribosylaminopyrimidine deaminase/5-amino-6-(5-phosphoribosylamino)uracil reductase RibD [Salisediminibacterium selenitireducens]|uniref:bifunctional diaminohydroxyphosphoribosylaminopyrimidine deaminase/5-amino-6-(5-phosphoribosylamino)uracil reductase RibD n=1 Tax=Salisediminibacterium selenitireducens TaxID=85683 RepID=UPI0002FFD09F|nr:bifunctional diaminohydroxyphosphoribosylaminopyrimidine deaminase/5-amino-6-(5-phosphoribosylamino)uracil reductase RibD [Salisediminibacterium selenitireducens]
MAVNDDHYMKLAIEIAEATKGQTSPNPQVGCVIVKHNQIKGIGAHLKAGEWHAERQALHMAKEEANGATAYVTLEPCSHHGKTPPCSDALIEAGISRVVTASSDPNPDVSGRGIRRLRDAGIEVVEGVQKERADRMNRWFFHAITKQTPYVTLKFATSLDGKIATATGESQWISNEKSRADVHRIRHQVDGILVGRETVVQDNPSLTTRLPAGGKNPIRIIMDRTLRTPPDSIMLNDGQSPVWIVTNAGASQERKEMLIASGAEIIEITDKDRFIEEMLEVLGRQGISTLLVEGGGTINDQFLTRGLFHEVIHYQAPVIIGGKDAQSSFSGAGVQQLANAPRLLLDQEEWFDDDVKRTYVYKA